MTPNRDADWDADWDADCEFTHGKSGKMPRVADVTLFGEHMIRATLRRAVSYGPGALLLGACGVGAESTAECIVAALDIFPM